MLKYTLLLALTIKVSSLLSQPIVDWQICLGGVQVEIARVILPLADGSFVIAGETESGGDGSTVSVAIPSDIWIVKLTPNGIIEWSTFIAGNNIERVTNVQVTNDGGYLLSGSTNSEFGLFPGYHGLNDILIVKLDANGDVEWEKALGGSSDDFIDLVGPFNRQYTTILTNDGGFVISGQTRSLDGDVIGYHAANGNYDIWVVKLDFSGNIIWQRTLGGTGDEILYSIIKTESEDIVVMGKSESTDGDVVGNHGFSDVWVVKLTATGELLWQRCYGGSYAEEPLNDEDDFGSSIHETNDGGLLFVSTTRSNDGDVIGLHDLYPSAGGTNELIFATDIWVVKTNSIGEIVWQKCLGSNSDERSYEVIETSDGGSLVSGLTWSIEINGVQYGSDGDVSGAHGFFDLWIVKLNDVGEISWQRCLGGSDIEEVNNARQHLTIQSADGGYITGLTTMSFDGDVQGYHGQRDIWIVKLDNSGNLIWQKCLGGTQSDGCRMIHQTSTLEVVVMGSTNSYDYDVVGNMGSDIWVVKLSDIDSNTPINMEGTFRIYPNPTNDFITMSVSDNMRGILYSIYDISGKKISSRRIEQTSFSISLEDLPSGVYSLITENGLVSRIVRL
jgi:hypothetical protein